MKGDPHTSHPALHPTPHISIGIRRKQGAVKALAFESFEGYHWEDGILRVKEARRVDQFRERDASMNDTAWH